MVNQFERQIRLIGEQGHEKLKSSRVIVFGVGGVGSYAVEALARSGIGHLALVDADKVCLSNLNRQLIALHSTVGKLKVEVAAERIRDINPDCSVSTFPIFYLPETSDEINLEQYDYIVDCIDTITAKIELAVRSQAIGVPLISCMGTGNKMDPSRLQIADISKTLVCPLARVMRLELRKRGINHLRCVFSTEEPIRTGMPEPGSTAFVPSTAGLLIASAVIRDLLAERDVR